MARKKVVNFNNKSGEMRNEMDVTRSSDANDSGERNKKRCFPKRISFPGIGILSALLSAFFFSANALVVKLIRGVHPVQLSLARAGMQFLILLPWIQYKRHNVDILGPEGLRKVLWLRGIVGSTAMIALYMAITALSLGNAITITYLSMILVPFVARIFLKEALAVFDIIFALVSLTGVVLIAKPSFLFPQEDEEIVTDEIGVLYAVACAALQATSMVTIRKLGQETYVPLNVLYYSICGSFSTSVALLAMQEFQFPCQSDLPYMFALGILGLLGQFFLTVALQHERAGTVGVLRSVQIIIVYVLQVVVLGDIPTTLSLIGAALIFSTSIGIGVRKIVNERRKRRRSVVTNDSEAVSEMQRPMCPGEV